MEKADAFGAVSCVDRLQQRLAFLAQLHDKNYLSVQEVSEQLDKLQQEFYLTRGTLTVSDYRYMVSDYLPRHAVVDILIHCRAVWDYLGFSRALLDSYRSVDHASMVQSFDSLPAELKLQAIHHYVVNEKAAFPCVADVINMYNGLYDDADLALHAESDLFAAVTQQLQLHYLVKLSALPTCIEEALPQNLQRFYELYNQTMEVYKKYLVSEEATFLTQLRQYARGLLQQYTAYNAVLNKKTLVVPEQLSYILLN